ncbi:MAG: prepilin-type N-terminal cleavage/methylation domain-containing protein [Phycisphaerales bacterium]|nr:prepilin-type N-terminal cleavage/methylation domain-containing protein [Phycisphaerales bacterium]
MRSTYAKFGCRGSLGSRGSGGYTLVELIIVIGILGASAAMVIPSMGSVGVLRIQSAVRSVVADITYAQMDALAYQEPRAVVFDEDANMYTLTNVFGALIDPDADALFDNKGPENRYRVMLDDAQFGGSFLSEISFNGGSAIIFDEMGAPIASPGSTALSDGGSVEIQGSDSRFRIDIAAFTGRVTVVRLN